MSIRDKANAAAIKYVQQGKYDKAILELEKIVQSEPQDARTYLKIGEMHVKRGAPLDALKVFQKAAELYSEQGFFMKAVAVYKQMLGLEPNQPEVQTKTAELYQQLGLLSEAARQYENTAMRYESEKKVSEAVKMWTRVVDLEPDNVPVRIRLSELMIQSQQRAPALMEFRKTLTYLKAHSRIDDTIRVAERLLGFDPTAVDVAQELAELYMTRREYASALHKYETCFQADQRNTQILERIVDAFAGLGEIRKVIHVLKEIARIHDSAGREDAKRSAYRRVLEKDPADDDAQKALGLKRSTSTLMTPSMAPTNVSPTLATVSTASFQDSSLSRVAPLASSPSSAGIPTIASPHVKGARSPSEPPMVPWNVAPAPSPTISSVDPAASVSNMQSPSQKTSAQKPLRIQLPSVPEAAPVPPPSTAIPPRSMSPSPEQVKALHRQSEFIKLMSEVDVFLRYGLKDKAKANLDQLIQLQPDAWQLLEKLRTMIVKLGDQALLLKVTEMMVGFPSLTQQDKHYWQAQLDHIKGQLSSVPKVSSSIPQVAVQPKESQEIEVIISPLSSSPPRIVEDLLVQDLPNVISTAAKISSSKSVIQNDGSLFSQEGVFFEDSQSFVSSSDSELSPENDFQEQSRAALLREMDDVLKGIDIETTPRVSSPKGNRLLAVEAAVQRTDSKPLTQRTSSTKMHHLDVTEMIDGAEELGLKHMPMHGPSTEEIPGTLRTSSSDTPKQSEDLVEMFFSDEMHEVRILVKQNMWAEAYKILQDIAPQVPESVEVSLLLKQIQMQLKDQSSSRVSSQSLTSTMRSETPSAEKSINASLKTVVLKGGAPLIDMALAYREMGLPDEAERAFKSLIKDTSVAGDALYWLGIVQKEQGKIKEARENFSQAMSMTSQNQGNAAYELGVLYLLQKNYAEGVNLLQWAKRNGCNESDLDTKIAEAQRSS